MALHLKPTNINNWVPKVIVASAQEKQGVQPFIEKCTEFNNHIKNRWKLEQRKQQMRYWAKKNIEYLLLSKINKYNDAIDSGVENGILPERIARNILK
jgi:putative protein kinase ArgK-like GTPase of G3E family